MQTAFERLPRHWVATSSTWCRAIAWAPIVVLLMSAAIEPMRPVGLVVLSVGFVAILVGGGRNGEPTRPPALAYGACMLVALAAVWSGVDVPDAARDGRSCATPIAPFAVYRAAGAVLVLAAVGLVVRLVGVHGRAIGMVRPSPLTLLVSLAALGAIGIAATLIGPAVAEPFFGPLPINMGNPSAIIPALIFALANATLEETVYRGVLLRWLVPARGVFKALVIQAVVFGLAHGVGNDFTGSPLPVIAATAAGGFALGAIALRTRSLIVPIALHAALDIPIYYANACLRV